MALDTTIITNAFAYIRANPNLSQTDQETHLANAIKQFVETAQINYTTGLIAPGGGGAVTGTFTGTLS